MHAQVFMVNNLLEHSIALSNSTDKQINHATAEMNTTSREQNFNKTFSITYSVTLYIQIVFLLLFSCRYTLVSLTMQSFIFSYFNDV